MHVYITNIASIIDTKKYPDKGDKILPPNRDIEDILKVDLVNAKINGDCKEYLFELAEVCLLIAGRSLMRHVYGLDHAWAARKLGGLYYRYYEGCENKEDEGIINILKKAIYFFKIANKLYASNINNKPFIAWAYADNCRNLADAIFALKTDENENKWEIEDESKKYYKKAVSLYLEEINNIISGQKALKDKYYLRDDFNNSEEHWDMALLYWVRKERYGELDDPKKEKLKELAKKSREILIDFETIDIDVIQAFIKELKP